LSLIIQQYSTTLYFFCIHALSELGGGDGFELDKSTMGLFTFYKYHFKFKYDFFKSFYLKYKDSIG